MQSAKFPLKVTFYKMGQMIYFSQLDLVHILERALRRSSLPVYYTRGFNPHVKISFSSSLKLGVEGQVKATFYFSEKISFPQLKEKLSSQLPSGLEIISTEKTQI